MATKIKLSRVGKMREPHYRVVIADARTKRDGRSIETIGEYHPKSDPSIIKVNGERAAYWLGVGAQPTEAVVAILKVTGDWQKFKGLPAPAPMLMAAPKPDKRALFDAALSETGGDTLSEATTPKKRAAPRKAAAADDAAKATAAPAEATPPTAEATADEETAAEATAAPAEATTAEATTAEATTAEATAVPTEAATTEAGS